MKTLFRIVVVLFVLLLVALMGGYLTVTHAGFQKRLVEGLLPAGSSIEAVHVTTGKATLSGLVLMLPDGTRVQVGSVDTAFEPLAAVFDQTIKMGVLQVEGLRVDLPTAAEPSSSVSTPREVRQPRVETLVDAPPSRVDPATNPLDALYALGDFGWLLDIDGIALEGVIYDGQESMYQVRVDSPAIRPGEVSAVDASLQLLTDVPLPSGLKAFDCTATLSFKQKGTGGFESLSLKSNTSGKDALGSLLISVQHALELEVDDAAGEATVSVTFDANLPKPQLLVPELAEFGVLQVSGHAVVSTDGETMTVSAADLSVLVADAELLALDLKHSMVVGSSQTLSGELLDISITELPLEWLNPWLSDGLQIQSQSPVSLALSVEGAAGGAFALRFVEPLTLGPLTLSENGAPLLQNLVVTLAPELQLSADELLTYALKSFSVADQYGSFIQGRSSGTIQLDAARGAANPFAGVQSQTTLQIGLQELFQLPVLAGSASIVSGQLDLNLNIDEAAADPLHVDAKISGLRARSLPNSTRDYAVALGVRPTSNLGEWRIGTNVLAGPSSRPSTELQFRGVVNASQEPLTFDAELSGPRLAQEDISILSAAFTAREASTVATPSPSLTRSSHALAASPRSAAPRSVAAVAPAGSLPPAWAMLDGTASISIDELRLEAGQVIQAVTLRAEVSEPKFVIDSISAQMGEGELKGSSAVLYAPSQLKPYNLTVDIGFEGLNPAFFAKKYQAPPVQGRFNGAFTLTGVGETMEAAIEDSTANLKITGEEGILTAFELDERKQLGLGLAGLLGQHLDRPGISALSNTIPYFKDILFDSFVFELTRGADKRVSIPTLRLTGDSILLDASGSVGASELRELTNQPLNLTLELGAKGRLADHLEVLGLLQPTVAGDGFRRWNQEVQITGSLVDPDTGGLMDILDKAAKGAFSKPKKRAQVAEEAGTIQPATAGLQLEGTKEVAPAEPEEAKKSKAERRKDDIEMGIDLLNSFFGN